MNWALVLPDELPLLEQRPTHAVLCAAARQGNEAAVRHLLACLGEQAAYEADSRGRLPLHHAAMSGHTGTLQLLLEAAPATAHAVTPDGKTALALAAGRGHAEAARLLATAAPASAAVGDWTNCTALHYAAEGGHAAVVPLLLAAAPSTAVARSSHGLNPLHLAASGGHASVVALLLAAAPESATMLEDHHSSALDYALFWGCNAEARRLILEAAPQMALSSDDDGDTALHCAAWAGSNAAAAVQLVLPAAPATALVRNKKGQLPLDIALLRALEERPGSPKRRDFEAAAQQLLAVGPAAALLAALHNAAASNAGGWLPSHAQDGTAGVVLPLFATLAARGPLSAAEWGQVPAPCPALAAALPAVLARSEAEAALLVARLPAADRQRLQTFALCLARVQRQLGLLLPVPLLQQLLALACQPAPCSISETA